VDLLPVLFVLTVLVLSVLSPHPLRFDGEKLRAWALFTVIWVLIVAVPSFVRFERSFLEARYQNLPGHALLITLTVVLLFTKPLRDWLDPVAIGIVALICAMIYGVGRNRRHFTAREFLYRWSPIILSFFMYENLRWFVSSLNPRVMDGVLAEIDLKLFGVHLSLVTEKLQTPWLSEWFSLHYAAYILYPLVTGVLFYYQEKHREFEDFTLAFCLSMYLGFLGYLAVPAVGPISGLLDLYHTPTVPGMSFSDFRFTVVEKYRYIRDAFPSLHAANSLLCLILLRRARSRLFWIFVFAEVNLLISTIYLRMHYTIDLVAGAALAVFACWAAPKINRAAGVPASSRVEPGTMGGEVGGPGVPAST
jgi:membrane-associated phospholipid phosphatase